jgi:hypothetical protein
MGLNKFDENHQFSLPEFPATADLISANNFSALPMWPD